MLISFAFENSGAGRRHFIGATENKVHDIRPALKGGKADV
jgi:hypothetical protein